MSVLRRRQRNVPRGKEDVDASRAQGQRAKGVFLFPLGAIENDRKKLTFYYVGVTIITTASTTNHKQHITFTEISDRIATSLTKQI